ncbi:MAG: uracil-DNA glycosylase [Alphaproteobacteria bacterium]|nr:uracil-DNA glycosylase [Alphaproteobacteria bacterium]
MCDYDLRDLKLSGVNWELDDIPMTLREAARKAAAANAAAVALPENVQNATSNITGRVATSVVPPIAPIQTMSIDTAVAMASRPGDIDSMLRMVAEFNHPLRGGATNVVLPHVAPNPNGLVIVTDMPGSDDDMSGRIMSGAAGELMDKMVAAIGMSRDTVSIVPMLFWRTPGGRAPSREEMDLARPFVNRILEMLQPRVILTLGTTCATEIGGVALPRAHGVVADYNGVPVMPIYHPNYLLLKPSAKRDAWNALQIVQNMLKTE